ncbi:hypothetical protein SIN8267_01416 [Sinobacterium norvegicum]|uniref:EamA domain-containing protein n=1 Tax=Sinobacterium norvegicum TaxID=1641715 RepID=A0ABN8EI76_9GAMM|nr:DMT family transporter [Sinobacterium norvegicum]CAH0991313.1 hypothetical protein SIN8267_01416 [Sinobacterium norvegicum]
MTHSSSVKLTLVTTLALLAFASNSVLCRLALGDEAIDPVGFTVIRLLSAITVLAALRQLQRRRGEQTAPSPHWLAAPMLFIYALTFSLAYVELDTGLGALVLFGAVQLTMIIAHRLAGHRLHIGEWLGLITAFLGFVYLVLPQLGTPSLSGFILMAASGIAWGIYTLLGRHSTNPLADTAGNFIRTLPFTALLTLFYWQQIQLTPQGIVVAVTSGAIASGIGYAIWYHALTGLSVTRAAVVQLLVPVLAAIGGIVLLNEVLTVRLAVASALVLGGILLVVMGRLPAGKRH